MNFEYNLNTSKCIPILLEIWRTGTVTNCANINQLGCNTGWLREIQFFYCMMLSICLCLTDENNNLKLLLCRSQFCGWYLSVFTAFGLTDLQQDGFPVGETRDIFKGLFIIRYCPLKNAWRIIWYVGKCNKWAGWMN